MDRFPNRLAEGLDIGGERESGTKDENSQFSDLSNWEDGSAV